MLWPRIAPFSLQERLRRAGISGGGGGSGASVLFKYVAGQSIANLGGTFTRTGVATYTDQQGLVQTAATGIPRITWINNQPCLLLEGARTNGVKFSNDLTNAAWTKRGAASVALTATGPDGVLNSATNVTGLGSQGVDDIFQTVAGITSGSRADISFWINRVSTSGTFKITNNSDEGHGNWTINLATLGAGWKLVNRSNPAVTINSEFAGVAGNIGGWWMYSTAGGPLSFAIYGCDEELGAFPSSTIVTAGAAVTRNADALSFPYTNQQQACAVYCDAYSFFPTAAVVTAPVFWALGAEGGDRISAYELTGPDLIQSSYTVGGTTRFPNVSATLVYGDEAEDRFTLTSSGVAANNVSINRAAEVAGTPAAALTLGTTYNGSALYLGNTSDGAHPHFVGIRSFKILSGIASLNQCRSA